MATDMLSPLPASAWNTSTARHLLNRAGFGVPRGRVAHLTRLGPAAAVDSLVEYEDIPVGNTAPDFLPEYVPSRVRRERMEVLSAEERQEAQMEFNAQQRATVRRLQAWWFERLVTTPRPLEEKMTLFWHGHFATSAEKVRSPHANYQYNEILRGHATGNFKGLAVAVAQSPAMLRYLDNRQNVKGKPNENWARELMELFTMGVGTYTENDIKESARAFTGWSSNGADFVFRKRVHDYGRKTFLRETGDFDGEDIFEIIFKQPVTAEFICRKLFAFFAYEDPEPKIVRGLASNLRENDYELKPLLRQLFRSKAFYSDRAVGSQIKSPAQFTVQLAYDLNLADPPYAAMARASAQLGQSLFYPPNVAGWEGGRAWVNTNTLLLRYNMPRTLVVSDLTAPEMAMNEMDMQETRRAMRKSFRAHVSAFMEGLAPKERRAIRTRMERAGSDEEKRAIMETALFTNPGREDWDAKGLLASLKFETAREAAAALADRFLSVPLSKDQKTVIAKSLSNRGALDAPLTAEQLSTAQVSAALHLIFSMAEYQLC